jgi:hypothetical protein
MTLNEIPDLFTLEESRVNQSLTPPATLNPDPSSLRELIRDLLEQHSSDGATFLWLSKLLALAR